MKVKRKVQLRRCSLCGRAGHNRARCSKNKAEVKVKNSAKLSQKTKLSVDKKLVNKNVKRDSLVTKKIKSGKYIPIKREKSSKSSPHVINLKKKEESIWDKVEAYQEKKKVVEKRAVVDFGEMVRSANQTLSTKFELPVVRKKVKYKRPKVKLPSFHFGFVIEGINNIKDISQKLKQNNALVIVRGSLELAKSINQITQNKEKSDKMILGGLKVIEENKGSTEKIFELIKPLIDRNLF